MFQTPPVQTEPSGARPTQPGEVMGAAEEGVEDDAADDGDNDGDSPGRLPDANEGGKPLMKQTRSTNDQQIA